VSAHRGTIVLVAGVLLGLTLPSVSAALFDFDLTSLGRRGGVLSGPVRTPTTLPFFDPDQLLTEDDTRDVVAIDQLFAAYVFYHDTFDGERLASLFLPDGIFEDVYNNYGTLEPTFGVGGLGCVLRGQEQIAKFISDEVAGNPRFPSPFPGHSHHQITSKLIKVDGDHATLTAAWHNTSVNDATGAITIGITGEYLTDFTRTPDGWKIAHNRPIVDHPGVTSVCDLNGPIPR
jgi:SnoaL-like domain